MATHSSILAWRIPIDRGACWAILHGLSKSQSDWVTRHIAHGAWCFIYDELVVEIAKILAAKRLGCSLIVPWDDTGYLV